MSTLKHRFEVYRNNKYTVLFISLVGVFFIWPLVDDIYPLFTPIFFFLLMFGVLGTLDLKKIYYRSTMTLGILAFVFQVLDNLELINVQGNKIFFAIGLVCYILFFLIAVVALLRNIFSTKVVSRDTILGGISVYYLIGLLWAMIYSLLILFDPEAISLKTNIDKLSGDIIYFSFTTLTTLGYGDIVPVSEMARNLTILESTIGPIYLTVLVARLVGLHISSETS